MVLLSLAGLLGPFHPVLVHLPIGILLVAAVFYGLSRRPRYAALQEATRIALLLGALCAVASCITGLALSRTGDYDGDSVDTHQWLGISVAVVSLLCWYLYTKKTAFVKWIVSILVVLIFITGHTGGSLTHGSDFLTKGLSDDNDSAHAKRPVITNIQEAAAYNEVVMPLLREKCYSCHNANKQKGGLRLDQPELLLQGGKTGLAIVPLKPDESEMMKRLLLPKSHEDHMPPKEKAQLSEQEIALLHWWISQGADLTKKVKEMPQPANIVPALLALQSVNYEKKETVSFVPEVSVGKAEDGAIKKLTDRGVVVLPVAANSNYLMVNFITVNNFTTEDLKLLQPISKNLVWLKVGNLPVKDEGLMQLVNCKQLTRLNLEHTGITDKGIASLAGLPQLRYLNIVGNAISGAGIQQLSKLSALDQVYLYKTQVDSKAVSELQKKLPKARIDTGGYEVPTLVSDTTIYKAPEKKV